MDMEKLLRAKNMLDFRLFRSVFPSFNRVKE